MRKRLAACCPLLAVLLLCAGPAAADVRLPAVFGDNMVLQRGRTVCVWGWDAPGTEVTVTFAGQSSSARAGADGKWLVRLGPLEASARGAELTVSGSSRRTLKNVLVGEVWLCSGQSNMEQGMRMINRSAEEIAAAKYPLIRLFLVPRRPSAVPVDDVAAAWKPCSPKTLVEGGWGGFSAAAYFFGRTLHKELNVPVGLIEAAWGGTRIEPWTPPEGFAAVKRFADIPRQLRAQRQAQQKALAAYIEQVERWLPAARAARDAGRAVPAPPAVPTQRVNHQAPSMLYNGMVHPLVPFTLRGAIWYQGESNNGEGMLYLDRMKALIAGWRAVWANPELSFYYVQLAPFRYGGRSPEHLPGIWEAQVAALAIPHTGIAGTGDIGNIRDIHPRNKQDVGRRLALWALAKDYGRKDLVCCGPLYKAMKVEGAKVRIFFDHVGGGLASRDGKPLTCFTLAGPDGKFAPATAEIDGNTVVVSRADVQAPRAVRFAWTDTAEPNLCNREGLPALPFRTDAPAAGK